MAFSEIIRLKFQPIKSASAVLMWSQETAFEAFRIKSSPPIPQIYKMESKNNDFIVQATFEIYLTVAKLLKSFWSGY